MHQFFQTISSLSGQRLINMNLVVTEDTFAHILAWKDGSRLESFPIIFFFFSYKLPPFYLFAQTSPAIIRFLTLLVSGSRWAVDIWSLLILTSISEPRSSPSCLGISSGIVEIYSNNLNTVSS